jgi:hypothetical protein
MQKTNYSLATCENLIQKYQEINGEITILKDGCLGLGLVICEAQGKKTAIIEEYFINSWVSGHSITMYNKTPKKFLNQKTL